MALLRLITRGRSDEGNLRRFLFRPTGDGAGLTGKRFAVVALLSETGDMAVQLSTCTGQRVETLLVD